jgi:tRNA U34 5-methylaminomethyl-2-thiouridine-forming methyltransferase MnmC
MDKFEIVTLKSGVKSLRSVELRETFHPVTGPLAEANRLHVGQQRLVERCAASSGKFFIWDVGLGAAANALAAIEALSGCQARVEIHSFDKTPAPLEFAITHAQELEYPLPYLDSLRNLIAKKQVFPAEPIEWLFHCEDFRERILDETLPSPDAIFYDPYSPSVNREMWTLDHFERLHRRLNFAKPCLLTNYSRSTAVRTTLMLAGFFVGAGHAVGEKDETTIASNQLKLLEEPLGTEWLERVRNSTNAAPLRGAVHARSPIQEADFDRLRSHPQFA